MEIICMLVLIYILWKLFTYPHDKRIKEINKRLKEMEKYNGNNDQTRNQ